MSTQDIRVEGSAYDALNKLKSAFTTAVAAGNCLIWHAIGEYIFYRAFRAAGPKLMALDGQGLKDIGLDRSEIEQLLLLARQELFGRRRLDAATELIRLPSGGLDQSVTEDAS